MPSLYARDGVMSCGVLLLLLLLLLLRNKPVDAGRKGKKNNENPAKYLSAFYRWYCNPIGRHLLASDWPMVALAISPNALATHSPTSSFSLPFASRAFCAITYIDCRCQPTHCISSRFFVLLVHASSALISCGRMADCSELAAELLDIINGIGSRDGEGAYQKGEYCLGTCGSLERCSAVLAAL
jgi:hypothetical protein